jgi:ABC-type glycerol-3-phosphate transport system permease component
MLFSHFNFGAAFTNSIMTAITSTILTLCLAILAAYGFSRYRFKGSTALLLFLVFVRMCVPASLLVPLYEVLDAFNLINTPIAIIIGQLTWTVPFSIWLLKGFFDELPKELEEAAYVDGASTLRMIRSIVIPIAIPGIAVATIFAFMTSWMEFLFSVSFATSYKVSTTCIASMITRYKVYWGEIAAGGLIFSIPSIIVAAAFQQYFIRGLTVGAVKG